VLLTDYLPRVIRKEILDWVVSEAAKPGHGKLVHRPLKADTSAAYGEGSKDCSKAQCTETVKMPHEFAIGFRFGHSQLRSKYVINTRVPYIPLFQRLPVVGGDLRGSTPLIADHVIDWNEFYLTDNYKHLSLRIDTQVTHVVFDLPETAIPDAVKELGNLPHRNLIRSRQIEVCCGEDLALRYNLAPGDVLTPDEVDSCQAAHVYFTQEGNRFKTPLWYYILKEAEQKGVNPGTFPEPASVAPCANNEVGGCQLGPLGSRLVAEVIVGGIFYGQEFGYDPQWTPPAVFTHPTTLEGVLNFVGPVD
jgi:hypothetical protein